MFMRLVALLLALSLPVLSFGESTYTLKENLKTDLISKSKQVKSWLAELEMNLTEKDNLISSLENHSEELKKSLTQLDLNLQDAIKNLDDSEKSRIETQNLLNQVKKELTGLSRSWKDYRFWSDVRFYSTCGVAVVLAVLLAIK